MCLGHQECETSQSVIKTTEPNSIVRFWVALWVRGASRACVTGNRAEFDLSEDYTESMRKEAGRVREQISSSLFGLL